MRRAILIGVSDYLEADFPPLNYSLADLDRLESVLRDPRLGHFDEVLTLRNPGSSEARRTLEKVVRRDSDHGDALLFYYSGHGKLDLDGSLSLIMSDTESDYLGATSLQSDELKRMFNLSRATQKVIVLDCCYGGAIGPRQLKSSLQDAVGLIAHASGTFVLTASSKFQPAFEVEDLAGSALTAVIEQGIRTGDAAPTGSTSITLNQLAAYARKTVPKYGQQPQIWDIGGAGEMVISWRPKVFDAGWAKKTNQAIAGLVAKGLLDEDLYESLREAIRLRDRPEIAPRLTLIDRLATGDVSLSRFVRRWDQVQGDDSAAAEAVGGEDGSIDGDAESAAEADQHEESPAFAEEAGAEDATGRASPTTGEPLIPSASEHPEWEWTPSLRERWTSALFDRPLRSLLLVLASLILLIVMIRYLADPSAPVPTNSAAENLVAAPAENGVASADTGETGSSSDPPLTYTNNMRETARYAAANERDPLRYVRDRATWSSLPSGSFIRFMSRGVSSLADATTYRLSWRIRNNRTGEILEEFCSRPMADTFPGVGRELADRVRVGDRLSVMVPGPRGWAAFWDKWDTSLAPQESLQIDLRVDPDLEGCPSVSDD